MHTDTPLAGHPTLALAVFGLALAVAGGQALYGLGRVLLTDRRGAHCGQAH